MKSRIVFFSEYVILLDSKFVPIYHITFKKFQDREVKQNLHLKAKDYTKKTQKTTPKKRMHLKLKLHLKIG